MIEVVLCHKFGALSAASLDNASIFCADDFQFLTFITVQFLLTHLQVELIKRAVSNDLRRLMVLLLEEDAAVLAPEEATNVQGLVLFSLREHPLSLAEAAA